MWLGKGTEKELYSLLNQGQVIIAEEVDTAFSEAGVRLPELAQGLLQGCEIRPEEVFSLVDFQRLHNRIISRFSQLNLPVYNRLWLELNEVTPGRINFGNEGLLNRVQEYRNTLTLERFINVWIDQAWYKAVQTMIPGIPKALVKKIKPAGRVRAVLVKDNFDHPERCRNELTRCLNGYLANLRIKMKREIIYRFETILFEIYDEMVYMQNHLQKVAVI
ncbi:MAG: hypothetical protein M0Z31_12080 [Clostridia bacterium]|nr:hypothetical protein [Clostridia bacterium]